MGHNWLVAALLGAALVVGIRLNPLIGLTPGLQCIPRLHALSGGCVSLPVAPGHGAPIGAITETGVGHLQPSWWLGGSELYWAGVIVAAVTVTVAARLGSTPRPRLLGSRGVLAWAAVAGIGANAVFHAVGALAALANVVSAALVIALVAVFERSRGLFCIAVMFVAVATALSHVMPDVVMNHLSIAIPPASAAQGLAGLALMVSAAALRWRSGALPLRWLAREGAVRPIGGG